METHTVRKSAIYAATTVLQHYSRADDNEEIAIKRFNTYEQSSAPVLDYYRQSKLLKVINGENSISQINDEISGLIDGI